MTSEYFIIMCTILVYLAGMLMIGFYCAKQNDSTSEFFLGGRKMGPYITAMSAEASDMSSYLLMGLPGLAYLSGMAHVGWTVIGLVLGTYFNWLLTAKRLRRYSHVADAFTFPQFLSKRYHDQRNILAFIAAIIIVIFFVPYTASGFATCGKLFDPLWGRLYGCHVNFCGGYDLLHCKWRLLGSISYRLCTKYHYVDCYSLCCRVCNLHCRRLGRCDGPCERASWVLVYDRELYG